MPSLFDCTLPFAHAHVYQQNVKKKIHKRMTAMEYFFRNKQNEPKEKIKTKPKILWKHWVCIYCIFSESSLDRKSSDQEKVFIYFSLYRWNIYNTHMHTRIRTRTRARVCAHSTARKIERERERERKSEFWERRTCVYWTQTRIQIAKFHISSDVKKQNTHTAHGWFLCIGKIAINWLMEKHMRMCAS